MFDPSVKKRTMLMPDPDSDILPGLMRGDQKAFAILVDRHVRTLSGLAANMLGDLHAAEDIAQAVFLKTWQMLPNWQTGQAKLITWMRRVATNMCLDYLRKHKPIYTDSVPDQPDSDKSPEGNLLELEQSDYVRAGMRALPDRQRAALTLFYFQDLSQKESADILDLSLSAYDSLLRRARGALKAQLQPEMRSL